MPQFWAGHVSACVGFALAGIVIGSPQMFFGSLANVAFGCLCGYLRVGERVQA